MTNDYDTLLSLRHEADAADRKASEAEEPWKEMAYKIAFEMKGLCGRGEVRFERDRFLVPCHGTGIYSHEMWWESFPIEPLLNRMRESSGSLSGDSSKEAK